MTYIPRPGAGGGSPGPPGADGADGAPGVGVPTGGATGQILAKASSADYDTHWVADQTGGGGGTSGIATIRAVTATSGSTTNLTSSDAGVTVTVNVSSAGIITVPTGMPTGMEVNVARIGTGSVSLVAASGVTWVPNDTRDTITPQGGMAYLLHLGSNVWLRSGGLV